MGWGYFDDVITGNFMNTMVKLGLVTNNEAMDILLIIDIDMLDEYVIDAMLAALEKLELINRNENML